MDHSGAQKTRSIIRGLGSLLWEQNYNPYALLQGITYKLHNYKKFVAPSKLQYPAYLLGTLHLSFYPEGKKSLI